MRTHNITDDAKLRNNFLQQTSVYMNCITLENFISSPK